MHFLQKHYQSITDRWTDEPTDGHLELLIGSYLKIIYIPNYAILKCWLATEALYLGTKLLRQNLALCVRWWYCSKDKCLEDYEKGWRWFTKATNTPSMEGGHLPWKNNNNTNNDNNITNNKNNNNKKGIILVFLYQEYIFPQHKNRFSWNMDIFFPLKLSRKRPKMPKNHQISCTINIL